MELKVQELTQDSFAPFGSFSDVQAGYGDEIISFMPDRMLQYIGTPALDSISSIRIQHRPLIVDVTEYHNGCEEVFGGFNCDLVFHVGLLGRDQKPDFNSFRLFRLPRGYFARVKRMVLHHAGFVLNQNDVATGIVLLPPATYTIDCTVLPVEPKIKLIV